MANVAVNATAFRKGRSYRVRATTLQATTGQTDWIAVPTWATYMRLVYNLTDVGVSTTPISTPTLVTPANPANPNLADGPLGGTNIPSTDSVVSFLGGATLTSGFTAAGTGVVTVGPGVTGIANDVALGTSGVNNAYVNEVLPEVIGIKIVNDRTTGDETYSYTVDVMFR